MITRLYREWCETESAWKTKTTTDEILTDEFVCPVDAGHTIRDNSLIKVTEINDALGMNSANGLQLVNGADSGKVNIIADRLNVQGVVHHNVSLVADLNVSGANGLDVDSEQASKWYSVWAACDGSGLPGTLVSLLSLSAVSPALSGGETHKFRVGWVRNNGSGNVYRFINASDNNRFMYNENYAQGGSDFEVLVAGSQIVWTDINLTAICPPTCREAYCSIWTDNGGSTAQDDWQLLLRPKDGGNISTARVLRISFDNETAIRRLIIPYTLTMDSSQIVEYQFNTANARFFLYISGYSDNRML